MPAFPSYYLSNLERKRQRSRELREGLQSGMAGAFEGVDRLAQLQMALQGKATAGAEAKAKAEKEAEALAHGRSIEAANQARADTRFKWEEEDRARRIAREDAAARGEIADPDREAMMAGFGETLRGEGVEPTSSDILAKFRAAVENPAEATGRYAEEPGEVRPEDVEGQTTSPEAGDILSRLKASLEPGAQPMAPAPPSAADKMEAARLRKMEADAAIAERKAKGGGGVPGVTSKKEIDRQRAQLDLEREQREAADPERKTREKKEQQIQEVEGFVVNIKDAIDTLHNQIERTGTFEMFGPESADMERAITSISTDLAKLKDPGSVAREGEVALMRKGLFPAGWEALGTRNETAKQILDHLEAEIEQRRQNAYRVRGLPVYGGGTAPAQPPASAAPAVSSPPRAKPAPPVAPSPSAPAPDPQAFFLSEIRRVSTEHKDWTKEQILSAVKASMRERGLAQ